jgi:hypothetical protein
MGNYIRHSGHCYEVKNQNGFKNALKKYFEGKSWVWIKNKLYSYPTYYPCMIVIVDITFEAGILHIESFKVPEKLF